MRALIASLIVMAAPGMTEACSCFFETESIKADLERRTIFVGKPVKTRDLDVEKKPGERPTQSYAVTNLTVLECWQGDCGDTIEVQHYRTSNSCGKEYDQDHPILIIASQGHHGFLVHGPCEEFHPAVVRKVLTTDTDFSWADMWRCTDDFFSDDPSPTTDPILLECRRYTEFEKSVGEPRLWLYNNIDMPK